jgi:hypothetical protein
MAVITVCEVQKAKILETRFLEIYKIPPEVVTKET